MVLHRLNIIMNSIIGILHSASFCVTVILCCSQLFQEKPQGTVVVTCNEQLRAVDLCQLYLEWDDQISCICGLSGSVETAVSAWASASVLLPVYRLYRNAETARLPQLQIWRTRIHATVHSPRPTPGGQGEWTRKARTLQTLNNIAFSLNLIALKELGVWSFDS